MRKTPHSGRLQDSGVISQAQPNPVRHMTLPHGLRWWRTATARRCSATGWLANAELGPMRGGDGPNQVQVSRELLALRVLNREPLGTDDSSESSPLALWEVRGSLGEAEGGTTESQLEDGGMRRQGVHPGGEEPAAVRPLVMPSSAGLLAARPQPCLW